MIDSSLQYLPFILDVLSKDSVQTFNSKWCPETGGEEFSRVFLGFLLALICVGYLKTSHSFEAFLGFLLALICVGCLKTSLSFEAFLGLLLALICGCILK